ncbi:hypothetical protein [Ekhidna sp.]|uniref:toxin-antitoxin system YwqK family antitoxin n=1 Tax=Ekhidna sp. TaxID=2608089 RepID=UPI003297B94F
MKNLAFKSLIYILIFSSCESRTKETHYSNGIIRERVEMNGDKKEGKYEAYFENGALWKEAYFKNNELHGEMNIYYPTGEIMIERTYKKGKIEGTQYRYWKNSKINEILDFKDDKPHGNYFYLDSIRSDTLVFSNYYEDKIRYQKMLKRSGEVQEHYMHYEVTFDTINSKNEICFKIFAPTSIRLYLEVGDFESDYKESKNYELKDVFSVIKGYGNKVCYDLSNHNLPFLRGHLSEFNKSGDIIGTVIIDEIIVP